MRPGSENWNIGPETSERAAKVLKVLYNSEKGGVVKTFTGHRDIRKFSPIRMPARAELAADPAFSPQRGYLSTCLMAYSCRTIRS
jgi:hypothetical protein